MKSAGRPAVAPCRPPRTETEWWALFDRLRALRDAIKPVSNEYELAMALIEACIGGGICTKPGIVSALVNLHMDNRFAGAMVDRGAEPPARWRKGPDKRYSLLV